MKIEWNRVTWYSKLLAAAFFVALPFVGFGFGMWYGGLKQRGDDYSMMFRNETSVMQGDADVYYEDVAAWQTDQNHDGWSIAYPIDFDTNDNYSSAIQDDWRLGTTGGPGLKLFTLSVPRAFEPQTNFAGAVLSVGASRNSGAVAQCLAKEPMGGSMTTRIAMVNGVPFTVFHFTDAGAGNYYETTSYRTIHLGTCYAIEYTVHSGQIGNYPPEYQLKPFNDAFATSVLDRIARTFKFGGS